LICLFDCGGASRMHYVKEGASRMHPTKMLKKRGKNEKEISVFRHFIGDDADCDVNHFDDD
jgi:hypothetical protein